jgi:hypothetical protein
VFHHAMKNMQDPLWFLAALPMPYKQSILPHFMPMGH